MPSHQHDSAGDIAKIHVALDHRVDSPEAFRGEALIFRLRTGQRGGAERSRRDREEDALRLELAHDLLRSFQEIALDHTADRASGGAAQGRLFDKDNSSERYRPFSDPWG